MIVLVDIAYAFYFILERYVVQDHDFNQTMFWTSATQCVVGIVLYIFFRSYRKSFHKMLSTNGPKVICLNLTNELLSSFANVISTSAGMIASVALVSFISQSVQPFAVMGLGILITAFFPKVGKENATKGELAKRLIAIVICAIGLACIEFG